MRWMRLCRMRRAKKSARMVEPLVLLHGWGLNRCVWDALLGELDATHAFPLDLAGYGCNTVSPYDLATLADDALVKAPTQAIWIGSSLGGMIALQAAIMRPERIAKLVLVGTTPRFVKENDWRHGTDVEVFMRFAQELETDYLQALHRFLLLQAGRADNARRLVRELIANIDRCGRPTPEVLRAGMQCLQDADLRSQLDAIACPTLIVQGELDRITPPTAAEYLNAHIDGAELRTMHAGHLPFMSHPSEFIHTVDEFLCS